MVTDVDCQEIMKKTIKILLESTPGVGLLDTEFTQVFDNLKCDGFLFLFFSKQDRTRGTTIAGGGNIPDRAALMVRTFYPDQYEKFKDALTKGGVYP